MGGEDLQEGRLGTGSSVPSESLISQWETASGPAADQGTGPTPLCPSESLLFLSPIPHAKAIMGGQQENWDSIPGHLSSFGRPYPPLIWEPSLASLRKPFMGHSARTGFPQLVLLFPWETPRGSEKDPDQYC